MHRHRDRAAWRSGLIAAASGLLVMLVSGVASARTVQSFQAAREMWPQFAEFGLSITLEGRYSAASGNLLRLEKCELQFRPEPGKTLPRVPRDSRNVQVTGVLKEAGNSFVFIVKQLRELPSDAEEYKKRLAAIDSGKPEQWYELGEWARSRGKFYDDESLIEQGQQAFLQGLTGERRNLEVGDTDGLLALSSRAGELGLSRALQQELRHEAWRVRWETQRRAEEPDYQPIFKALAREFPGSAVPAEDVEPELVTAYQQDPLGTYRKTAVEERGVLHRLFFREVVEHQIAAKVAADGSNGSAIAAELEQRLPELAARAEMHRQRELEYRLGLVSRATRGEAMALAETFREREQPALARRALSGWLANRTTELRKEGTSGLLQASDDYLSLLDDKATATKLLEEAYALTPESAAVRKRFEQLGYRFEAGRWVEFTAPRMVPEDPIQQTIRDGHVTVGMSPSQVRQTLGAPRKITRIASLGKIHEVWQYPEGRGKSLTVHFLRRSHHRPDEARAVGLARLPGN